MTQHVLATRRRRRSRAGGFSLIEILVSIIVLTVGLLGASGMLLSAIRTTQESGNFSAAVNFARELSEKTRANKTISVQTTEAANSYLITWAAGDDAPGESTAGTTCISSPCTAAELADWDINEWVKRVDTTLPGARVRICFESDPWDATARAYKWDCNAAGRNLVVKIGWTPRQPDPSVDAEEAAAPPPRVVVQLIPGQDYAASGS